jgi:tryptophanyl-tRNA synthetase
MTVETPDSPLTLVTGIKPTGRPHLGNYLGSIRPAFEMARQHRAFYFIHQRRLVYLPGSDLVADPHTIFRQLENGGARARETARQVFDRVRQAVGTSGSLDHRV